MHWYANLVVHGIRFAQTVRQKAFFLGKSTLSMVVQAQIIVYPAGIVPGVKLVTICLIFGDQLSAIGLILYWCVSPS